MQGDFLNTYIYTTNTHTRDTHLQLYVLAQLSDPLNDLISISLAGQALFGPEHMCK